MTPDTLNELYFWKGFFACMTAGGMLMAIYGLFLMMTTRRKP